MNKCLSESQEQKCLFNWISLNKHLKDFCFHIPNGGYRNIREAYSLKKQGVMPGVADIFLAIPNKIYHGLWIELKRSDKSNKLTRSQSKFLSNMDKNGYACCVAYGWINAKSIIETYINENLISCEGI